MSPPGYTIVRQIASGGMGTVYLARREGIEGFARLVALKRAHSDQASDPVHRRGLISEAAAASSIHHANVVSVIDVVERADEIWLVLEWVDGCSLARLTQLADRGRLPPAVAARIVLDAAAGVAAAHELVNDDGEPAGLRHRDVSPQNILVGRDGVSRLADFGLSKSIDATLTATTDRLVEGKLGYLAPELFAGKAFDERCDLYAMAVVAWEALAGRRLFRGRTLRELSTEQAATPLLSSVASDNGRAFDAVFARALSIDPTRRHQSVREFVRELEAAARLGDRLATPLEVASVVAQALGGRVASAESPARTPTTGPLIGASSAGVSSSSGLDEAPTPIAPDEQLRAPPAAVQPLSPRRSGRGAALVAVACIAATFAGAIAVGKAMGERPAPAAATSLDPAPEAAPSAAPSDGPPATVPAEAASGSSRVEPAIDPAQAEEGVVDLDGEAVAAGALRRSVREAIAPAAPKTAKSIESAVPAVPRNPYRKAP